MSQPRLLGGRYELESVIGRGGMAEVYRARDLRLDRVVAVKTLRSDLARDPTFQERFRREAQSAASLNHPSVIAVYDTGEDSIGDTHIPYIVMEYVDGSTLRDLLRENRALMPQKALEITDGILRALDYSHRGGIVHRDIKPANVMLTRQHEVKVMDFGIARAMHDSASTMTQTAQVIGTAQYLSPEQARGERVDARSDLYSTGCVLYELLTGRPPFTGDSPVAIAYQHVREEPTPPSQVDPDIPHWADAIVLKAMAKSAADRYQNAGEFRQEVQRALHGQPVASTAASTMMMGAAPTAVHQPQHTQVMGATQVRRQDGGGYDLPPVQYGDYRQDGDYDQDGKRGGAGGKAAAWIGAIVAVL
ncbi:Stk1 family PASTA domain-containing Ser/Thr kinase, partial [Spirillospora sp. NPDC049652]